MKSKRYAILSAHAVTKRPWERLITNRVEAESCGVVYKSRHLAHSRIVIVTLKPHLAIIFHLIPALSYKPKAR